MQCLFTKIKRFNFDGSTEAVHLSKNLNSLLFEKKVQHRLVFK
jgi:hypothetical protein